MLFLSHWPLISKATWSFLSASSSILTFTYLHTLHLHNYVIFIYIVPFSPFSRKRSGVLFLLTLAYKAREVGAVSSGWLLGRTTPPLAPTKVTHPSVSRWQRQSKASSTWPAKDGAGSCWPVWGWGRPSFPRGTACGHSGQAGFWTPSGRWSKSTCSWHQIVPQMVLWFGHCWRVGPHGKDTHIEERKQEFTTRPHTYNAPILFI